MSEFGTGFAYNLGLFLAHAERHDSYRENDDFASLWFNGASDHLSDLEIPNLFVEEKRKEIEDFKKRCLEFRYKRPCTWKDVTNELQNAKDYLRQWDQALGIKSEKGDYE